MVEKQLQTRFDSENYTTVLRIVVNSTAGMGG